MKNILFLVLLASCGLTAEDIMADAVKLDRGGFSVDLTRSSAEPVEASGVNFVKNGGFEELDQKGKPVGWIELFQPFTYDNDARKVCIDTLKILAVKKISSEGAFEGKNSWEMSFSEEDYARNRKNDVAFSNTVGTIVVVPECEKDTKFLLTVRYRGTFAPDPQKNSFGIVVYFSDNEDFYKRTNQLSVLHQSKVFNQIWKEWQKAEMTMIVPKGVKAMNLELRQNGCGTVQVDDVRLSRAVMDKGVSIRMVPLSFIDNIFCLSSGQPGILKLSMKNESQQKLNNPVAVLELPEGFELLDVKNTLKLLSKTVIARDGNKFTYCKVQLNGIAYAFQKSVSYPTSDMADFLITTNLPAGNKTYKAHYWYEDGDYKTEPLFFDLKVIPRITGKTPKLFETGAVFHVEANYDDDKAVAALTSFYSECGFNNALIYDLIHYNRPDKFSKGLLEKGIKRYVNPVWLSNGYRIGKSDKPDDVKFIQADGSCLKDAFDAICPVEVYKEGGYFRDVIIPKLREILVGKNTADSIMSNWEPYMYDFKGCFCPKCKKEFVEYSKLPESEVETPWPKQVAIKYKDVWIKFRSWQHGKMVGTLEKTINKIGKEAGKDSHFVPEIATGSLTEKDGYFAQYNPVDFLDKLPVVEAWGPYIFHPYNEPYVYNTGSHLVTFLAAKDAMDYMRKIVGNPPKMIAFPHGIQCANWVTEPEALTFETLCFFLNGWNGSMAYLFPGGYDARYWAGLAKANTLIAAYEDFVFTGTRQDGFFLSPETPIPEFYIPEDWNEGVGYKKRADMPSFRKTQTMLQSLEYKMGEKRLLAVGNFWEKGEVFFRLSTQKLDKAVKYVLHEPEFKRCYSNEKGETSLSATDFENGVLMHAGVLRWAFLLIEPYKEGVDYGEKVSPAQMSATMRERLPEIGKAADFEKKYRENRLKKEAEKNNGSDLSAFKDTELEKLSCRKEKSPDGVNEMIVFEIDGRKLSIAPSHGANVASWVVDKMELVNRSENGLGLCSDAFWWPGDVASITSSPYEFEKVFKEDGAIKLQFRKKLVADAKNKTLDGVDLLKTYTIFSDGSGFNVKTEIRNKSTTELKKFSFRYHNMLSFLESRNGKNGYAVMNRDGVQERFERMLTVKLYRIKGANDTDLEKASPMDSLGEITSPEIRFECPWSGLKISADILNRNDLHSFIFWDSGRQECASFEPLFRKVELPPASSWSASMTWKTGK